MTFLYVLLVTVAACFALREPLRRWPVVFYVLVVVFDIAFLYGSFFGMPRDIWLLLYKPMQKAMVPLAMFVVIMYIGVFPQTSRVSKWLRPVRGELSIVASLLTAGHVVVYLGSYFPRLFNGSTLDTNVVVSFAVALILLVLLIVLGVTSFQTVKKRMDFALWKRLQRWAYAFFMLVYVHLVVMLGLAALHGGIASTKAIAIYSVVFLGWAVLRLVRAALDRKEQEKAEA